MLIFGFLLKSLIVLFLGGFPHLVILIKPLLCGDLKALFFQTFFNRI